MNSFTCFDNGIFAEPQSVKNLASAEKAIVLLVSDTHGDFESVQNMLYAYGKTADALMFAGDGMEDFLRLILYAAAQSEIRTFIPPVVCLVAGNCDLKKYTLSFLQEDGQNYDKKTFEFPSSLFLTVCKTKILLTHGHIFGADFGSEMLADFARQNGCKIAVYGHTHVPYREELNDVMLVNPGSLSRPRGNSEKGFARLMLTKNGTPALDFFKFEN